MKENTAKKGGFLDTFMNVVEAACNKLPPPTILFCYLFVVFCQVLFPEKSVGIPFFQQGIFPAFSGHYASLRMRACSIR